MKHRITVTIDKDLLCWLDSKVGSRKFANRSHGLEFLIHEKRSEDERAHNDNDR